MGPVVARGIVVVVGIALFAVFLAGASGSIPALSVAGTPGGNPCTGICPPLLTVTSPTVTVSGFNATITIHGTASPVGQMFVRTAWLNVANAIRPLTVVPTTTGIFSLPPVVVTVGSVGTYTAVATLTASTNLGGTLTTVSPITPFTVTTKGNGTGSGCGSTCPTATPAVSAIGVNLVATATDSSTTTHAATSQVIISWGDGAASNGVLHGKFNHTYAAGGTYILKDTVIAVNGTFTSTATASMNLVVFVQGTGGNTTSQQVPPSWHLTPITGAGIGGSVGLVVMGATGRWREGAVVAAILAAGGGIAGFIW